MEHIDYSYTFFACSKTHQLHQLFLVIKNNIVNVITKCDCIQEYYNKTEQYIEVPITSFFQFHILKQQLKETYITNDKPFQSEEFENELQTKQEELIHQFEELIENKETFINTLNLKNFPGCPYHPAQQPNNQKCKFYCYECDTFLCQQCYSNNHMKHCLRNSVYKQYKKETNIFPIEIVLSFNLIIRYYLTHVTALNDIQMKYNDIVNDFNVIANQMIEHVQHNQTKFNEEKDIEDINTCKNEIDKRCKECYNVQRLIELFFKCQICIWKYCVVYKKDYTYPGNILNLLHIEDKFKCIPLKRKVNSMMDINEYKNDIMKCLDVLTYVKLPVYYNGDECIDIMEEEEEDDDEEEKKKLMNKKDNVSGVRYTMSVVNKFKIKKSKVIKELNENKENEVIKEVKKKNELIIQQQEKKSEGNNNDINEKDKSKEDDIQKVKEDKVNKRETLISKFKRTKERSVGGHEVINIVQNNLETTITNDIGNISEEEQKDEEEEIEDEEEDVKDVKDVEDVKDSDDVKEEEEIKDKVDSPKNIIENVNDKQKEKDNNIVINDLKKSKLQEKPIVNIPEPKEVKPTEQVEIKEIKVNEIKQSTEQVKITQPKEIEIKQPKDIEKVQLKVNEIKQPELKEPKELKQTKIEKINKQEIKKELPQTEIKELNKPETKEIKQPEVKEVKPETKEIKQPEIKEVKQSESKNIQQPEIKESKQTESKELKLKDPKDHQKLEQPEPKAIKRPEIKISKITKTIKLKQPEIKQPKQPEIKKLKEPEVKDIKPPEIKEIKPPKVNESKQAEIKEQNQPEPKEIKKEEPKEIKQPEVNVIKQPESKEIKQEEQTEVKEIKQLEPKEIKQEEPKEVKPPEIKEIKKEEPKEINQQEVNVIKQPDVKEIKQQEPKEVKQPEVKEIKQLAPKEIKQPEIILNINQPVLNEINPPIPKEIKNNEPKEEINQPIPKEANQPEIKQPNIISPNQYLSNQIQPQKPPSVPFSFHNPYKPSNAQHPDPSNTYQTFQEVTYPTFDDPSPNIPINPSPPPLTSNIPSQPVIPEKPSIRYPNYPKILFQSMIKEIKIPFGSHTNHIKCALILQNDNIAICGSYTTIKVFDLKKLKCMMKYKGHKQQINSLCLYGENEFLSCSDDRTVCRWLNTESNSLLDITKVKKGKKAQRDSLEYHRKEVLQLLQLDDSVALSCSEDGTIREWDFRVTKEKYTELLKLKDNEVPKVMIKINTKNIIIITNKNHLHIFNIENKTLDKKVIQLPNDSIISAHSIKKIGPGKLLVGRKHGLTLFDLKSKMMLYEINNQPITTVQTFQILNPNSFICASAKKVYVYSLEDSSIIKTYEIDCIHKETPTCFAFVSFNRTLFSVSSDSHIIKWKLTYT